VDRKCSVCGGAALVPVLELPNLPLTGLYVEAPDPAHRGIDQGLDICEECGHGQLRHVVDPRLLYADSYAHRSTASPIAMAGNDFFADFLTEIAAGATFERIVEIGCNDLYLLHKLAPMGKSLHGIDPIWRGRAPPPGGKLHTVGKFIEAVDFARDIGGAPDLVVAAHCFEHIDDIAAQLARLLDAAADGALFVIEVPGFESLLRRCRFDQVFHQHIHYFSLASFRRLLRRLGGAYLSHRYNHDYWGGTLLLAFRKSAAVDREGGPAPAPALVRARLKSFRAQLEQAAALLRAAAGPKFGFGAAQMLPILAYHMGTDFNDLDAVLDDNPDRQGLYYPDLAPPIRAPGADLAGACVVVTALDSARPILARLTALGARDIVVPLQVL
jgi:hypothetical protein